MELTLKEKWEYLEDNITDKFENYPEILDQMRQFLSELKYIVGENDGFNSN